MGFFDLFKNKNSNPGSKPRTVKNKTGHLQGRIYLYPDTPGIMNLLTKETPRQILETHFPKHEWPISGGWGYTKEDAVVLEVDNEGIGVDLEYQFLQYRTYEETIVFRPRGRKLAGLRFETLRQYLVAGENGKHYDCVTQRVHAFMERDFELLKRDWETHDAYIDDKEGRMRHLALAESKRISFEITGWFDISNFYGIG